MSLLAPIRSWWKALRHRSRTDREIETELQFHIDVQTQHLMEAGLPQQEAARRAKIDFGRVDVQKEKYRAAIGLRPLHQIGSDLRYGIRSLCREVGRWLSSRHLVPMGSTVKGRYQGESLADSVRFCYWTLKTGERWF
jgi:hypothetical protein